MGYLLPFLNTIEWQLADWLTWGFRVRWPRHWLAAQVKWVSGPWHRACSHTAAAGGGGGSVLLKAVEHSRRRTHVDLSVQFVHQSLKQLVLGSTQLHAHLNQHTQVQALLALLTRCTDRPGSAYTTTSIRAVIALSYRHAQHRNYIKQQCPNSTHSTALDSGWFISSHSC